MRRIIAFLVIVRFVPGQAQQLTLRDLMATPMKVYGADCAVFPLVANLDTLELHVAGAAPLRFMPTRQQVEEVEKQLSEKGFAATAKPTVPPDSMLAFIQAYGPLSYIHTHLLTYKRQYYGFYNPRHQPCLYINFIEAPASGWLYRQVVVMDGGASYWQISYNLVTHQFYGFGVNGEG